MRVFLNKELKCEGVSMSGFKKAERFLTNPTIAITGPTGAGKTMSALRLAAGIAKAMNGRFAVIDTENGSASLYSHLFDFDTLNVTPPFTTEKYISAISDAEKEGYCALVCDSITHAWAGEGGLLEQKAQLDARPGSNHWTNWGPIKAKDLKFRNAYLHSSVPFFIATMRSKMEYAQTENNGKKKVEKQGMAPVQSDGIEYEFSVVLDVAMNHEAEVSKDRTHLFDKKPIFTITEDVGEAFVKWRSEGKAKAAPQPHPVHPDPEPQVSPPDEAQSFQPDDTDLDAFLGPNEHPQGSVEEAGTHVIPFGQWKGKRLNEVPDAILTGYCTWLEDEASRTKKPITPDGQVGVLLSKARIWLGVE